MPQQALQKVNQQKKSNQKVHQSVIHYLVYNQQVLQ
ncbi:hypothetical protein ACUW8U_001430 [Staphylococcus auricularis]